MRMMRSSANPAIRFQNRPPRRPHDRPVTQKPVAVQPELLGDQVPGKLDGLFLEIVAEREIAEHLEEGVMARGVADIFEVVVLAAGAHAFLRCHRAVVTACLKPVNRFLNCTMPALVNISVGSFCGTSGLESTIS